MQIALVVRSAGDAPALDQGDLGVGGEHQGEGNFVSTIDLDRGESLVCATKPYVSGFSGYFVRQGRSGDGVFDAGFQLIDLVALCIGGGDKGSLNTGVIVIDAYVKLEDRGGYGVLRLDGGAEPGIRGRRKHHDAADYRNERNGYAEQKLFVIADVFFLAVVLILF